MRDFPGVGASHLSTLCTSDGKTAMLVLGSDRGVPKTAPPVRSAPCPCMVCEAPGGLVVATYAHTHMHVITRRKCGAVLRIRVLQGSGALAQVQMC